MQQLQQQLLLLLATTAATVAAAATGSLAPPTIVPAAAAAAAAAGVASGDAPPACHPVDAAAVPGTQPGALSQPGNSHSGLPFLGNTNAACAGPHYRNKPCSFVDTAAECRAGCVATAGCTAWNVFYGCNTGPKPPGGRTKHSCELLNLTAASNDGDGHYVSGTLKPLPPANAWPMAGGGPPKGCTGNSSSLSFCDVSLPPEQRAALLSEMLTPHELADCMNDEMPAIDRLGIAPYRYGHEGLHGYLQPCPVAGAWMQGGKCFTDFPTSSAVVNSFNRSLWFAIGSAEADEARGTYNAGFGRGIGNGHEGFGLHIRGPQVGISLSPCACNLAIARAVIARRARTHSHMHRGHSSTRNVTLGGGGTRTRQGSARSRTGSTARTSCVVPKAHC